MKRIHSVVKQYGNLATTLVVLSPIATNKIAQIIEKKIGNPEIRVNAVNGKFILEGFANSKEEKDKAEIVAKMYVPDVVVDEPPGAGAGAPPTSTTQTVPLQIMPS